MLKRTTATSIWQRLPRIVFEEGARPAVSADAAALRAAEEARQRAQRVASLCGVLGDGSINGNNSTGILSSVTSNNTLHSIVKRSSALKSFVETMPAEELLQQPVLDRRQALASQLVAEQERRVMLAREQLRAAKRQLRSIRNQGRNSVAKRNRSPEGKSGAVQME
jgi:hypothetical protein